jgi:Domain of unknown function (DUF6265)
MRIATLYLIVLAAAGFAHAADRETRSLADDATSPPATLADVAWIAGRWVGEGFDAKVEEVLSPPQGDAMIGHFRMTNESGVVFYELLQVREEGGSLVYRVKHFHPDLRGWEEKDAAVDFPLVAIEADRIYFDGLTIARTGPDEITHWLRVRAEDGTEREAFLLYQRAPF